MNNRISPVGGGVAGVAVAAAVVAAEPTPWDLWLWVALDVSGAPRQRHRAGVPCFQPAG